MEHALIDTAAWSTATFKRTQSADAPAVASVCSLDLCTKAEKGPLQHQSSRVAAQAPIQAPMYVLCHMQG
jgi:hypothetical protein